MRVGYAHRAGVDSENSHVRVSVRPATIRRGSSGTAYIRVQSYDAVVKVQVSSSYLEIAVVNVVPELGKPPFTASITVSVSSTARQEVYYLNVTIIDIRKGSCIASTAIPVFVVDSEELAKALKNLSKYRKVYEEYGVQYTLLKILMEHGLALTFSELKVLYEAVVGRRVSNGTVGDLLSRLLKKGLLVRIGDRYIFNSKLDLGAAKSIIDVRRAINGVKGARALVARNSGRKVDENSNVGNRLEVPRSIERALTIASKLVKEDYWKAVDFIAHTLIGVRKTGTWLLWIKDYFIYREEKTGFLHYFRSEKLSKHLRSLGLRGGFMAEHVDHSAEEVIKSCYRSYANARRLHYLLKDLNWFTYSEPLILELYPDPESPYIALKKLYSEEAILEQGNPKFLEKIRRYIVYPGEHIDEENEETYHHRAAGTLG